MKFLKRNKYRIWVAFLLLTLITTNYFIARSTGEIKTWIEFGFWIGLSVGLLFFVALKNVLEKHIELQLELIEAQNNLLKEVAEAIEKNASEKSHRSETSNR